MQPEDLNFDGSVYPNWRPFQYQTVEQVFKSKSRFIVISAPTGAGKSLIALGIAQMAAMEGLSTNILTKDTRLQDQYKEYNFKSWQPEVGIGRRNYPCILEGFTNRTADIAPCVTERGFQCPHAWKPGLHSSKVACPYYKQRTKVDEASIRILNYPYFFLGARNSLFKCDILICDEGHNIDSEILKVSTVKITDDDLSELKKAFKIKWPAWKGERLEDNEAMLTMAETVVQRCMAYHTLPDELISIEGKCKKILDLWGKVVYVSEDLEFKPIVPKQFTKELLFSKADKVILMSATIFGAEYWKKRLGADDVEYIELPSNFPAENCPVILKPVANFNYKDFEPENEWKLRNTASTVDRIISDRLPRKGIIHTVSYKRADDLINRSVFGPSEVLILGQSNRDIKRFINSKAGVLISPAITEGLDFPDELCEYVIWLKVPYPNLTDPVVRITKEIEPDVYMYQTLATVVQGSGRGFRHIDDRCEVFILDSTWAKVYDTNKSLLPNWFKERYRGKE